MPRRFKRAAIKYISLCPKGANKLPVVYKEDGHCEFQTLIKSDTLDELGEITAVVYAPNTVDADGDIASTEVIKQMAYSFSRDGEGVDLRHDNKVLPKDKAYVAESFLVQKNDPRFSDLKDYQGESVDATGAWAVVIKIEDSILREKFKKGEWSGVSMAGTAEFEEQKEDTPLTIGGLGTLIKSLFGTKKEDIEMDKKELTEVLAASNKELISELAKALKPEENKEDTKTPEVDLKDPKAVRKHLEELEKSEDKAAPEFKGDITKEEDVKKHALALKIHQLEKATDMSDPEAIMKLHEDVSKLKKEFEGEDEAEDEGEEDSPEVRSLKKKLEKALGKSSSVSKGKNNKSTVLQGDFSKEERQAFLEAEDMVEAANYGR